jgi:hypothetical protein
VTRTPTGHSSRCRSTFDKSWLWFSAALAILLLGLLIGPRVADDQQAAHCVVNLHLPGPFGIALNCDSPEFLRLATTPSALLEKKNARQSRPGMILAAYVVSLPILPLANIPSLLRIKASRPDIDSQRIDNALAQQFPAYVAYMVLNLLILYATFFYFRCLCIEAAIYSMPATQFMIALGGVLLVANDVVKAYFWTPHSQMCNVFIPVFAVYIFVRVIDGGLLEKNFAIVTGLITGIGVTAYPTFVIIIPCTLLAALLPLTRAKIIAARVRWFPNIALFLAASVAPGLLWFVFVQIKTGEFYLTEIAGGPEIWIPAALSHGGLEMAVTVVLNYFRIMLALAAKQAFPLAAVLVIAAAVALKHSKLIAAALRHNWAIAFAALIISGTIAGFYSLAGDMHYRWAYALIPPFMIAAIVLILAVYHELSAFEQRALRSAVFLIAVCQLAFTIIKDGPFS